MGDRMATAAAAAGGERPRDGARVSIVWVFLVLLLGAFAVTHDIERAWDSNYSAGNGELGFRESSLLQDGFLHIEILRPGGALEATGVRNGDDLRPDQPIDFIRRLRPGERIGVTVRRNGALSHHIATVHPHLVTPQDRAFAESSLAREAGATVIVLIGMFVALRSGRRASTLLFAAALVCLGLSGDAASLAESDPRIYPAWRSLAEAIYDAAPVLFLAFALAARGEVRGDVPRAWRIGLIVCATAQALACAYWLWVVFTLRTPVDSNTVSGPASFLIRDVILLLALLVLGLAWRESHGRDRVRFGYMLLASGFLAGSLGVVGGFVSIAGNDWTLDDPLVVVEIVGLFLGVAVFVYALLRHRVIDIGFAVNRTLIYAVVSAILLAAFGLIEWAVEHFIPIHGQEENALLSAAIAVGVFLTFHRVRDVVEHGIEHLFFRRWQKAEAALRRFVREAAFATRPETLTRGFAAALTEYAEGAEAAVYLLGRAGAYHLAGGAVDGAGEALDPDDPALMSMRAEPKALAPEEAGSALKAVLVAPMVNRNEVIGLVLLGPKPSRLDLRPDEVELIGWATRQVGLDLHALKVEQLEATATRQAEQISLLNAKLEVFQTERQSR